MCTQGEVAMCLGKASPQRHPSEASLCGMSGNMRAMPAQNDCSAAGKDAHFEDATAANCVAKMCRNSLMKTSEGSGTRPWG